MTNAPIDRINDLIAALEMIKANALENEKMMREDDPLADSLDAMIATFEIIEDQGMLSLDDLDSIKNLIMNP